MNLINAVTVDPIVSVNTNGVDSSSSSWNVDSSRLLQLMMGGTASSVAPHCLHYHNPNSENPAGNRYTTSGGENCSSNSICNGSNPSSHDCCVDGIAKPRSSNDVDLGKNRALPPGWERCLDLKSGEIYMKKSEEVAFANANSIGGTHKNTITNIITRTRVRPCPSWQPPKVEKQDWLKDSYSSPIQPTLLTMQNTYNTVTMNLLDNNAVMSKRACLITQDNDFNNGFVDREPDETLCLDLDLSLANEKRSKVSYHGTKGTTDDTINPNSSSLTNFGTSINTSQGVHIMSPLTKDSSIQHWKWQAGIHTNHDSIFYNPAINADIQDMIRVQTMVTATCSHCLTRVLLKKSNPKCPRCSNPIILECANNLSKKRPYTT